MLASTWWPVLLAAIVAVVLPAGNCLLTLEPANVTVVEEDDANFTCSPLMENITLSTIAPGSEQPVEINDSDPRVRVTDIDSTRVYTWLNASRNDNGREFFCATDNEKSATSILIVNYGVSIQVLGTDFTAMIGHNFSVPISVDGNPTPTVQWTHNGVVIESTARLRADINGLFLTPSTFDDFGDYVVTATNNISSVNATFSVGISVLFPDFIAITSNELAVKLGDNLTINCTVSADFPVSVSLTKDGSPLLLDAHDVYSVANASSEDAGEYECRASFDNGTDSVSEKVAVQVGDVPGEVSNIMAKTEGTDAEDELLVIEWDAADNNGVTITNYEIVIEYDEKTVFDDYYVLEPSITIARKDLDIPDIDDGGEFVLTISVSAVNGIGKGNTEMVKDTVKFSSTSSSSRPMIARTLLGVLLLVVLIAM